MVLTNHYLITTKNLKKFLASVQNAQAPERFTYKFLEQLGFASSNDRLLIGLLKSIDFLDESGIPTERYYKFLDQTESAIVLAEGIKESYEDLFQVNKKAYEMTLEEIKNKLKTLTQGKKSEKVTHWMAMTFKSLCEEADFKQIQKPLVGKREEEKKAKSEETRIGKPMGITTEGKPPELHYNIQIVLPDTRDTSVYDAIFRSLKEHLL